MLKNIVPNNSASFKSFIRVSLITVPVAIAIGSMIALFLVMLNWAIHFRFVHTWLLYLLPLAGIGIHLLYKWYGASAERGNNLIIDEIHQPGAGVPKRMAPLILITTVITHLFGGSAGREGTAVQIGGSLANFFVSLFKLNEDDKQMLLTAGIAAGFGAVFGTPFTGMIFAMEVLTVGKLKYEVWLPCLIAGWVGDQTVAAWGVQHTPYYIANIPGGQEYFGRRFHFELGLLLKTVPAAALFGLASYSFAKGAHLVKDQFNKWVKISWLIPVCGGLIIIGLTFLVGKPDYLSLGVNPEYPGAVTLVSAFQQGGADFFSWLWKLIFTTITLGSGFKGGEVTPLFYIGATLGNTLAGILHAPVGLFAGLGFIAVFAGATKTPLACTVMGMELFGPGFVIFYAVACFVAFLCSGKVGIYSAQRRE